MEREWFAWHWYNLAAKGSGLECACVNNDDFTVLVSGDVEYVHCVVIAFRMTERVEERICINFELSLNIPPWKLIRWFRRLQLWTAGDWQLHHNSVPTHASHLVQSFLVEHQITQVTLPPYSPDLVPSDSWLSQFNITFEREAISDSQWDSGQLMAVGRIVWSPKVPTLKRTEASLSYV